MTQAIERHFPGKKDVKHVETCKLAAFQSSTYLFTIHQSLICQHGILHTTRPPLRNDTFPCHQVVTVASSFWSIYQTARSALSMSSTWQRAETLVEATCWILPLKPYMANSLKWRHVCSRRYIVQGPIIFGIYVTFWYFLGMYFPLIVTLTSENPSCDFEESNKLNDSHRSGESHNVFLNKSIEKLFCSTDSVFKKNHNPTAKRHLFSFRCRKSLFVRLSMEMLKI